MSFPTITAEDLLQRWKENQKLELLDVRTPAEFREVHVQFAKNVPLDQLNASQLMEARNGSLGSTTVYYLSFW